MKRKFLIFLIAVGALLILGIGGFIMVDRATKSAVKDIAVYTQDARETPDGTYEGSYELPPVKVTVRVSALDGIITDIAILEHQNGLGGKAERIVDDVLERQSLDVDAVSGATASSKAILKAIENAIRSGENGQ
jgi:uncharacterized protein with FMN-binding domain